MFYYLTIFCFIFYVSKFFYRQMSVVKDAADWQVVVGADSLQLGVPWIKNGFHSQQT